MHIRVPRKPLGLILTTCAPTLCLLLALIAVPASTGGQISKPKTCINGATTLPYSLEDDIRSAGRAGFEQVEIWSAKLNAYLQNHTVKDLKKLLREAGVTAAAICPYSLVMFGDVKPALDTVTRAAQIASEIGCPVLLVCPDAPPQDMPREEAFKKAGREARRYAEAAAKYGVKIAIEPLGMHPFVPGPKEALRIIREANHPALGLMIDTFHYYKSGVTLDEIRSIPVNRLLIVHVNGCESRPPAELNDGHRLYPGEGIIPITDIFRILKQKGYKGPLSVEVFRQEYWKRPVDTISREAKRALDTAMAKVWQ
ncbi:MAG: sugar phosphate isomerase/epimerase family protein [Armatimonadota bacterium]